MNFGVISSRENGASGGKSSVISTLCGPGPNFSSTSLRLIT